MTDWLVYADSSGIDATPVLMRRMNVCPKYDGLRCFSKCRADKVEPPEGETRIASPEEKKCGAILSISIAVGSQGEPR